MVDKTKALDDGLEEHVVARGTVVYGGQAAKWDDKGKLTQEFIPPVEARPGEIARVAPDEARRLQARGVLAVNGNPASPIVGPGPAVDTEENVKNGAGVKEGAKAD